VKRSNSENSRQRKKKNQLLLLIMAGLLFLGSFSAITGIRISPRAIPDMDESVREKAREEAKTTLDSMSRPGSKPEKGDE
jgi:hypothetical protein